MSTGMYQFKSFVKKEFPEVSILGTAKNGIELKELLESFDPDMASFIHARMRKNGVKLLLLGTVETGGGGCVCPEHVMLRRIISHLMLRSTDVVIMDMEAGLEHLGRGTCESMEQFIVVIEPGARSVQTYKNVKRLAEDLGIRRVRVVANKVRGAEDEEFVRSRIPEEDLLGFIHYNTEVIDADRRGQSPFDVSQSATEEIRRIKEILDQSN